MKFDAGQAITEAMTEQRQKDAYRLGLGQNVLWLRRSLTPAEVEEFKRAWLEQFKRGFQPIILERRR